MARSGPGRRGVAYPAVVAGIADLLGGQSTRSRSFLGGLAIGALVGAAIAGTSWLRRLGSANRP